MRSASAALAALPLLGALLAGGAAAQVTLGWSNEPGGVAVARDAADQVYTARWDYSPGGDIYVAKRSPAGALLWEVRHDNTDSTRHEVATAVGTDRAGNVLVAGTIRSGYASPVNANSVLMKFSPDGALLWRQVYASDFDGSSTRRLLVDAQDRVLVLGIGTGPAGQVSTVRQFLPDGSLGWVWFDAAGIGAPEWLKATPQGHLLVSARGSNFVGVARLDAQGATLWHYTALSLTAGDAASDAAGNTYVVGSDYAAGSGTLLRKLSPAGAVLWERAHPMSAFRVEVGPDGQPVIGGFPSSGLGGAAFAKFDADGNLLWTNLDADGPAVGLLQHAQMLVDAAGSAYIAGTTLFEMGVAKVLADGSSAWTALAPRGGAFGMALGSVGQVYVVGGTTARLDQAPVVAGPDLSLTLADAPDPVAPGGTLVYTATVRNLGTTDAPGVRFTQALPRGLTWLSSTPSVGSCTGGARVACRLGTLAPGATATVYVTAQARNRGTLSSTATVSTTATDANPADNSATATTTVAR